MAPIRRRSQRKTRNNQANNYGLFSLDKLAKKGKTTSNPRSWSPAGF
jgi:hypothetical protein